MPSIPHYIDAEDGEAEVVLHYDFSPYVPETRLDPASGGVEPWNLTVDGNDVEFDEAPKILEYMLDLAREKHSGI